MRRSLLVELVAMSGVLTAITIVMFYPYARHLDWVSDLYDPLFSIWRIAWVAYQLPRDPAHLYDANIFWPERYTLAYSDGMPLTGAAAAPFIWLGAPPAIVHNVFVLASFVLCGLAMYLLVRSLVGSRLPAVVSAVAFAFYPFRFEHFLHIELLSAFWMPLALWALHKTLNDPGRRWRMGLLTGALVAAQYLSSMYFGVFLACFMLVLWGVLSLARKLRGIAAGPLLVGALLTGVLIMPSLPPYAHVRSSVGERSKDEVRGYSAQPADYLAVHHPDRKVGGCNERQVFPGFLLVVLALAAFWPPLSSVRVAYLLGLAFAFDVSLGSNGLIHPYLYEWFLPFRGLRVPARFSMLVGLSLAVLAGFGTARLAGLFRRQRWKVALVALLCGVILAEPRPTLETAPRATCAAGVPTGSRAVQRQRSWRCRSGSRPAPAISITRRPIGSDWRTGSAALFPRPTGRSTSAMRSFPDEGAMDVLRAAGIEYAVIHEEVYGTAAYREMIGRVERSPSLMPCPHGLRRTVRGENLPGGQIGGNGRLAMSEGA